MQTERAERTGPAAGTEPPEHAEPAAGTKPPEHAGPRAGTGPAERTGRAPMPARARLLVAGLVLAFAGAIALLVVAQPFADAAGACGGG